MILTENWELCRRCDSKGVLEGDCGNGLRWMQPCPICGGLGKIFLPDPWGWKHAEPQEAPHE